MKQKSRTGLDSSSWDLPGFWVSKIEEGLREDKVLLDWTSLALSHSRKSATADLIAKEHGVIAIEGLAVAAEKVMADQGMPVKIRTFVRSGDRVKKGQKIAQLQGSHRGILALERTFINLCAFVSGIATQTQQLVEKIQSASLQSQPRLCATRKLLPGYTDLSLLGVLLGGGHVHRRDLHSGVLFKENHLMACASVQIAVQSARSLAPHLCKIEVEVRDLKELQKAIAAGCDGVLLDNFTPEQVRAAIDILKSTGRGIFVEVSGNVRLDRIEPYLIEGVHVFSSGALTHSVQALDLSLLLKVSR